MIWLPVAIVGIAFAYLYGYGKGSQDATRDVCAVLRVLRFGALSGYALRKRIASSLGIYPVLRRMEDEGMISSSANATGPKGSRTYWLLDGAGEEEGNNG